MNVTIYLPDDLGKWARRKKGLAVSLICRRALEKLRRQEAREEAAAKKRASA